MPVASRGVPLPCQSPALPHRLLQMAFATGVAVALVFPIFQLAVASVFAGAPSAGDASHAGYGVGSTVTNAPLLAGTIALLTGLFMIVVPGLVDKIVQTPPHPRDYVFAGRLSVPTCLTLGALAGLVLGCLSGNMGTAGSLPLLYFCEGGGMAAMTTVAGLCCMIGRGQDAATPGYLPLPMTMPQAETETSVTLADGMKPQVPVNNLATPSGPPV